VTASALVAALAQGVWIATLVALVLILGVAATGRLSGPVRMRLWWVGFGLSTAIPIGAIARAVGVADSEGQVRAITVGPGGTRRDAESRRRCQDCSDGSADLAVENEAHAAALRAGRIPLPVRLGATTAGEEAGESALDPELSPNVGPSVRALAGTPPVEGPVLVDGAWGGFVVAAIGVVALVQLLRIGAALRRTRRLKRQAVVAAARAAAAEGDARRICDDEWNLALRAAGATRRAPLLESSGAGGPMVVGYLAPAVLVPPGLLDRLAPAQRRHVLLHEAVHLARRDDWILLGQRVTEALLWFHPGLRLLARRLDADREVVCDGVVARHTGSREYARTLVHLAELAGPGQSFGMAPGLATRTSKLGRRVEELVGADRRAPRVARVAFAAALPFVALLATSVRPLRTAPRPALPPTVSDGPAVVRIDSAGTVVGALGVALDSVLREFERDGFSGTVLLARRGTVVLEKGYGLADRERGRPATAATRYSLAGFTKSVTAAAALRLAEAGRLSLQDSIGRWLPELTGPKRRVTIAQLLTYQDGMTRLAAPIFRADRAEFLRALDRTPAQSEPGTGFRYNDFGHSVLALIIERAAGVEYEDYVRSTLIEPLGLGFGFEPDGGPVAVEYQGPAEALAPIGPRGYSWGRRGSLGMVGTARDAYHWLLALDSARVISPTMRRAMLTGQGATDYGAAATYGWELTSPRASGGPLLRRVAGTPGMEGEILHDPVNEWSAVILVNTRLGWRFRIWNRIAELASR